MTDEQIKASLKRVMGRFDQSQERVALAKSEVMSRMDSFLNTQSRTGVAKIDTPSMPKPFGTNLPKKNHD